MVARAGHYEPVAREGYPYIIPPALCAVALWWFNFPWLALLFLLLTLAVALFFRNPERLPPKAPNDAILAPADGTVVEIVDAARSDNLDLYPLKRISIFMSIFNVHVNRSPISGTIGKITYRPGTFLDAREKAASMDNEHNSLVIQREDVTIEVVQVAGKVARRICCWVEEGDEVRRGERIGLIQFGSRLDVYVPEQFSFRVGVGTRVSAGVTVIAGKDR
jgi:phosphatidylserine decarboxylase